jgi:hypothetical protein
MINEFMKNIKQLAYLSILIPTLSFSAEPLSHQNLHASAHMSIHQNCSLAIQNIKSKFIPNNSTAHAATQITKLKGSHSLSMQIEVDLLEDSGSYFINASFSPTTTGCNISYSFIKHTLLSCKKVEQLPMTNLAGNDYVKLSSEHRVMSISGKISKYQSKANPHTYWFLQDLKSHGCNIIETSNNWLPKR